MKALLFETQEIELSVKSEATRPSNIIPVGTEYDKCTFRNVIVAWICVEKNDSITDANRIVDEILKYHEMVQKKIVIVPFFHLSSDASIDDQFNKSKIDYLSKKLRDKKVLEGKLGYGFHRAIYSKWITFGHQVSTAFRDSKF